MQRFSVVPTIPATDVAPIRHRAWNRDVASNLSVSLLNVFATLNVRARLRFCPWLYVCSLLHVCARLNGFTPRLNGAGYGAILLPRLCGRLLRLFPSRLRGRLLRLFSSRLRGRLLRLFPPRLCGRLLRLFPSRLFCLLRLTVVVPPIVVAVVLSQGGGGGHRYHGQACDPVTKGHGSLLPP